MSDSQFRALELLYDEGEAAVFTHFLNFQSPAQNARKPLQRDYQFATLNPIFKGKTRGNSNVSTCRNFLVEWDNLGIGKEEQLKYAESIGLPYSIAIYSGNKSVHFLICLTKPIEANEHRQIAKRVAGKANSDKSVVDAARLFRFPAGTRIDNQKLQEVLALKERVELSALLQWLGPENSPIKETRLSKSIKRNTQIQRSLTPRAEFFFKFGTVEGNFNSELFVASCAAFEAGYTATSVLVLAGSINGWVDARDIATVASAYRQIFLVPICKNVISLTIKEVQDFGVEVRR